MEEVEWGAIILATCLKKDGHKGGAISSVGGTFLSEYVDALLIEMFNCFNSFSILFQQKEVEKNFKTMTKIIGGQNTFSYGGQIFFL
jgi:hypothetical protein